MLNVSFCLAHPDKFQRPDGCHPELVSGSFFGSLLVEVALSLRWSPSERMGECIGSDAEHRNQETQNKHLIVQQLLKLLIHLPNIQIPIFQPFIEGDRRIEGGVSHDGGVEVFEAVFINDRTDFTHRPHGQ